MKAYKFWQALGRHPYLQFLLAGAPAELKPRHLHFVTVRPFVQLPRETFSSIHCDQGENSEEFWVDAEEWTVIFRIEGEIGMSAYRYCPLPFTQVNASGERVFNRSGEWDAARDYGYTPETNIHEFMRLWDRFYREVGRINPTFVAVVHINRSWGIRYSTFAPARVTIYQ